MVINLHKNFLNSLLNLSNKDQERVSSTISQLLADNSNKGLRLHKVGQFWSYSASMTLRLITWKKNDSLLLLHVNQHDEAYRWAERNKAILNSEGNFIGLIDIENSPNYQEKIENTTNDIDTKKVNSFINAGFSRGFSTYLAQLEEADLFNIIESFSPEHQEILLDLIIDNETRVNEIDSTHPSDIYTINDDDSLKYSLSLPEEKWRIFLHPNQRFAIEIPNDRNILLRGGPGTGKTVTILHRFVKLQQQQVNEIKKPVILVLNDTTRTIIVSQLKDLNYENASEYILSIKDFEKNLNNFRNILSKYSAILIDEGQDLPIAYIANLINLLDSEPLNLPPHFICVDANQAVNTPSGEAIKRLENFFDTITLTYCYRSTMQNIQASMQLLDILHNDYIGKDFIHTHSISSARDVTTKNYHTPIQGPQVEYYKVANLESLKSILVDIFNEFDSLYSKKYTRAIIVVTSPGSYTKNRVEELVGSEIYTPVSAKGREFFAGIIIDLSNPPEINDKGKYKVKDNSYMKLCGLYVGITRFRDRVKCLYLHDTSPLKIMEQQLSGQD